MEIKINKSDLKKIEVDIPELIGRISSGQAILFTGAGFSVLTENVNNRETLRAKYLAHEICKLGEFPEDDDLRFATDYYLANYEKDKLIKFLKEEFTLKNTHDIHNTICSISWRRFYTTNYDKSIEIASANSGKVVECVDISFPTQSYYKRGGVCVHLNGSIDSLDENTLNNSFKLSTSSYISPDSFINSNWHFYFKKDLDRCSAIIFIGYSMYDIEIQKILFENDALKEKTYFITHASIDKKTEFTLSKFGHILKIGVSGFADLINQNKNNIVQENSDYYLQSLAPYQALHENLEIRDQDVETMIMHGSIKKGFIDDAILSDQKIPYLIVREHLKTAKNFLDDNKNIVFYGDMGNGKSMLLSELQAYLSTSSIESYFISDIEGDYIQDIDHLSKSGRKIIIHIDGYEKYLDLISHYCLSMPKNINIVVTSRTSEHERLRLELKGYGFIYNEICIDVLSNNEIKYLIDIVDNLGMWGDNAGASESWKLKFVKNKNSAQISLALLELFNAPQIQQRISEMLSDLMKQPEIKDTIFSICLLQVIDIECKFSLVSELTGNDLIYSATLLQHKNFKNLFHVDGLEIKAKSSLFCLSLIRNYFSASYVTSQLLKIAKKINDFRQKDYDQETVFKATLKFSFVERLISDANKKANLRNYYESLKTSVNWLKNDPHFWLQYAMANITFKEYSKAQQFLKQSYSLAQNRQNYHTRNIDTQQARLFILIAMQETESHKIYENFSKGHELLNKLYNDVYKFRQVEKYRDFYDSCYSKLSKGNMVAFERACQKMQMSIDNAVTNDEINLSQQFSIQRAKENLEYILESIKRA